MLKRLPSKRDIPPVLAVIVVIVYGWSIVVFLWKIPSWILFLRLDEIAVIFAYMLVTSLLGSIVFIALLLFFCMLLPLKYFRENFSTQGALVSLTLLGSLSVFINRYSKTGADFLKYGPIWLFATILCTFLFAYAGTKFHFLRDITFWITDRLVVFLYFIAPLSVLSLIVVIARNVF